MRRLLATVSVFALAAAPAAAQQTPGQNQQQINGLPWTNGMKGLTGAQLQSLFTNINGTFSLYGSLSGTNNWLGAQNFYGTTTFPAGAGQTNIGSVPFPAIGNGATSQAGAGVRAGHLTHPEDDFGAPANTQKVLAYGVTCTSGSTVVSIAAMFTQADVGKNIVVAGCGAAGAPLKSTIQSVGVLGPLTLANQAGTNQSGATLWIAWGNDDAPAINASLARGNPNLILSALHYGIFSQINLPSANKVDIYCAGSEIVALAAMTNMLYQGGNQGSNFDAADGSSINNCNLDGMGIASQNINYQGNDWSFFNMRVSNATVHNILVTGLGEGGHFNTIFAKNDATINASGPTDCLNINYTDNRFIDFNCSLAQNGVVDNSTGTFLTNIHTNLISGLNYSLAGGGGHLSQLYADGVPSSTAAITISGTYYNLNGWYVYSPSGSGQIGVQLTGGATNNRVTQGNGQGVTAVNMVADANGQNWVFDNANTSLIEMGAAEGICFNPYAGCVGDSVALGTYANTVYGGIAVGHGSSAAQNYAIAEGYQAYAQHFGEVVFQAPGAWTYGAGQVGWWMGYATITNTSATRLTGNNVPGTITVASTFGPNVNGSLSAKNCWAEAHSTSSADAAYFTATDALFVRGASGAPTLVSAVTWTQQQATAGATGKVSLTTGVDGTYYTASLSATATSGSWHVKAACQISETD